MKKLNAFYYNKENNSTCVKQDCKNYSDILNAVYDIGGGHETAYGLGLDIQKAINNDKDFSIDSYIEALEPDVYTSDLTNWLGSRNDFVYYLTEAITEYGAQDGFQALAITQQIWKQEVARAIYEAFTK